MQAAAAAGLLALTGIAAFNAKSDAPAAGSPSCVDNCSLNGVCTSAGVCECDAPWYGDSCGQIHTAPAQPGGLYGFDPNVSSWGGNAVRGDDGLYHLFVAEMAEGGLQQWGTQSECTHAVATTVSGPFNKTVQDGGEALPRWCHEPYTLREPGTGEYLLFHIGHGNDTSKNADFMHHAPSPFGACVRARLGCMWVVVNASAG
jgi:hypothetical protein